MFYYKTGSTGLAFYGQSYFYENFERLEIQTGANIDLEAIKKPNISNTEKFLKVLNPGFTYILDCSYF